MKTNTSERLSSLILSLAVSLALMLTMSAGTITAAAVPLPGPAGAVVEVENQSGYSWYDDSLQDAVTTAQDGDTVRLLQEVELSEPLRIENSDAAFTLDLNAHTLSVKEAEGANGVLVVGGLGYKPTLTIIDSQHIDNGRITPSDSSGSHPVVNVMGGNLIICDGAIVSGDGDAVVVSGGKLTVKDGGKIESHYGSAITAGDSNSEVIIEGGTIKNSIHGIPVVAFQAMKKIVVTGGKFEGRLASNIKGFISGGSFTEEPQDDYIADGYMAIGPDVSGLYTVVKEKNTVEFDLQDHEGTAPASQEIIYGGRVTKPERVVSGTEAVDKWYKDPACSEAWNFNDAVTEDMTLYAKWQHYHDGILFDDWTDTDSLPDTSGNYVLKNNVELSSSWVVPEGEMNLCLNGKIISISAKDAPAIRVGTEDNSSGVTLKVYDDTGDGKITGANNTKEYRDGWDNGGGVNVAGSNVFELYGGNITGNYAYYGGGVAVMGTFKMYGGSIKGNTGDDGAGIYLMGPRGSVYKPVFNMYGGEVDGNTANSYGGGVYIDSASTFNMFDGKITDNKVTWNEGGGVYLNSGSGEAERTAFNLYGGEITGNTAYSSAGGVYVYVGLSGFDFNIGGEAAEMKTITVTGNKLSKGGDADIFLQRPVNIRSELTEDTRIGLRTIIDETDALTSGLKEKGSLENFFSDREYDPENFPRVLKEDEDGEVVYKDAYQITFDPGEGSGEYGPKIVTYDEEYPLPDNPFTEPSYKKFNGWKVGSDETIHEAGYVIPKANVTVTAQWTYRKHFIVFDAAGGSGSMEDLDKNEGSEYELPECGFTPPTDYIFKEWGVKIGSGSFVSKQPGDKITITADVTVKAEWEAHPAHTWNEGTVTREATETETGEKLFTCTLCGETMTEEIPKREASEEAAVLPAQSEIQDLPAVKIRKPKAGKKKMTVRWKKISKKNKKKIQGVEIQVATDSGFTNIVKTANGSKKKVSKTIKKLQPKTKYYVRIRAYKNAADGKHISAWRTKTVKVK